MALHVLFCQYVLALFGFDQGDHDWEWTIASLGLLGCSSCGSKATIGSLRLRLGILGCSFCGLAWDDVPQETLGRSLRVVRGTRAVQAESDPPSSTTETM